MQLKETLFVVAAVVTCSISMSTSADDNTPLTFYRDANGAVSKQSKSDSVEMKKIAAQEGYVSLWLLLNYPFDIYMDEMTEEEIAAQNDAVAAGFAEVLGPLEASGKLWRPSAGPLIKGPGCAVRATVRGLNALLKDDRILQISATK